MLLEAINGISEMATAAQEPLVTAIPGDDSQVIVTYNGAKEFLILPPSRRRHEVQTIADLVTAAGRWSDNGTIWHHHHGIEFLVDDDERRDLVTMPLYVTNVFAKLVELAKPNTRVEFTQKQIIHLLKNDLKRSIDGGEVLLAKLRAMEFKASSSASSEVGQGRESLGRSTIQQLVGGKDIPDTVTVVLKVYGNRDDFPWVNINCSLDVDAVEGVCRFKPLPDEIDEAVAETQAWIHDALTVQLKVDVSVFNGKPVHGE